MSETGMGGWGLLALFALVASPVSLMIGDPVHSVWIVGAAAIVFGLLAVLHSASRLTHRPTTRVPAARRPRP